MNHNHFRGISSEDKTDPLFCFQEEGRGIRYLAPSKTQSYLGILQSHKGLDGGCLAGTTRSQALEGLMGMAGSVPKAYSALIWALLPRAELLLLAPCRTSTLQEFGRSGRDIAGRDGSCQLPPWDVL